MSNFFSKGPNGILSGSWLAFFAYAGFEQITIFNDEAINPNRDIPLTLFIVLIISAILNSLVSLVLVNLSPLNIIDN